MMNNQNNSYFLYFVNDCTIENNNRVIWIAITRNYDKKETLELLKGMTSQFYHEGIDQISESKFINDYGFLLPEVVKDVIHKKEIEFFRYRQEFFFADNDLKFKKFNSNFPN